MFVTCVLGRISTTGTASCASSAAAPKPMLKGKNAGRSRRKNGCAFSGPVSRIRSSIVIWAISPNKQHSGGTTQIESKVSGLKSLEDHSVLRSRGNQVEPYILNRDMTY
ncbi:uncharacterized protein PV06_08344 [Exophiala oligosperma]|uniref:Uncharacterized protein n=1 Tax=Exophiala oligosperma TaxID=215243 RepID=A0A0D2DW53_9EURO|nr:uncharacterized protein PV06_08344 [Exophiala oligosperma]KIW39759.1 hypothetical protein PV06_08344 [Exophiala oligosperma]